MSGTPETPTIHPPTPEQADAARRAGHYYVWLHGAEYDDLTSRLSRAERIEAAAGKVANDATPDRGLDGWVTVAEELMCSLSDALAEPADDAGSGEEW